MQFNHVVLLKSMYYKTILLKYTEINRVKHYIPHFSEITKILRNIQTEKVRLTYCYSSGIPFEFKITCLQYAWITNVSLGRETDTASKENFHSQKKCLWQHNKEV